LARQKNIALRQYRDRDDRKALSRRVGRDNGKNGTLHPAIKRGTLDDTFFVIPGSDPESMMIPFLLGRWSYICTHPQKRDPGAEAGMKEK
jgi:hypothetical protein